MSQRQKKTIRDLGRLTIDEYRQASYRLPVTLVLDNIRSLNNIGSMLRTADALALEEVALCGITATPPSVEIHKTALGAEESVTWHYYADTMQCVDALHERGVRVLCLEQVSDSMPLQHFRIEPGVHYAIVVGHELTGVDPRVVDAADVCLEIPQHGTKHSLNVAVSAGMALWQLAAQFEMSM